MPSNYMVLCYTDMQIRLNNYAVISHHRTPTNLHYINSSSIKAPSNLNPSNAILKIEILV